MDEQLFPVPAQQMPAAAPSASLTGIATRLKLAEERYANLAKRNELTEGSLLSFEKDIKTELRVLTKQTVELRKRLNEINTKMDAMLAELNVVVQKHEFTAAERYLDLWQPMEFITREEAKRLIKEGRDA